MSKPVEYKIRPLAKSDQAFLWEMLYQSLYVPTGHTPFERSILEQPEIARYVRDWGREDDSGFVALDGQHRPVGAIWLRLLKGEEKGFGYVDDATPELGMAVLHEYRGRGVGTELLARMIEFAKDSYKDISLSVSEENRAKILYERMGFKIVCANGDSLTMKRELKAGDESNR